MSTFSPTGLRSVTILGTGSYVPERIVTNEELEQTHGFDADWVFARTGIRQRRFVAAEQATSDLCYESSLRALQAAGVSAKDIDLVTVGTFTPDMSFPSTGCLLQDRLGIPEASAFDLQAACAGFAYALVTAAQFVASGASERALVVGGDANSRILNPKDLKTFPLFGDGAGAVVLAPGTQDNVGLLNWQLLSDGSGGPLLSRPACGSRMPPTAEALQNDLHYMQMDGRAVFKWACKTLVSSCEAVLEEAGMTSADVDLFVPHQANVRIVNAAADVLKIPREKVFVNLDVYGNTSAGSIPIALDEAIQQQRLKRGALVLMSGFGAGLAWGTLLWRW